MKERIIFHGNIVLKGLARTMLGAIISTFMGLAVYGFMAINQESGYAAVGDFVMSCLLIMVSCCMIYILGGRGGKKK